MPIWDQTTACLKRYIIFWHICIKGRNGRIMTYFMYTHTLLKETLKSADVEN